VSVITGPTYREAKSFSWASMSQHFANNSNFLLYHILETEDKLNINSSGEATFELE
jgi:hypothetical protein